MNTTQQTAKARASAQRQATSRKNARRLGIQSFTIRGTALEIAQVRAFARSHFGYDLTLSGRRKGKRPGGIPSSPKKAQQPTKTTKSARQTEATNGKQLDLFV
jgi:hypothetical protein